mgnify:CR=1 FL=1
MKEINYSLKYEECYINHIDNLETYSRSRRLPAFKTNSHLKEVLDKTSQKHSKICNLIRTKTKGRLDHTSFWQLGTMAVVLTEPYNCNLKDFECDELYVVEIPVNIAPYCGYWDDDPEALPRTKSFLITTQIKKRQLDKIIERLIVASKTQAVWNVTGEAPK